MDFKTFAPGLPEIRVKQLIRSVDGCPANNTSCRFLDLADNYCSLKWPRLFYKSIAPSSEGITYACSSYQSIEDYKLKGELS